VNFGFNCDGVNITHPLKGFREQVLVWNEKQSKTKSLGGDAVLPNFVTSLLLIAVNLIIYRESHDQPHFGLLSSKAIHNIPNLLGYL